MDFRTLYGLAAVAVLAMSRVAATTAADQCQSGKANLDVRMKSNLTGHWTTTIQLKQQTTVGSPSQPEIHLQAEPSVSVCGGVRTNSLLVTLEGPPPPPPTGYVHFPGVGTYKLHTEKIIWEEAKTACEKEGAHLLIINSEKEAAAIRELFKQSVNHAVWIYIGFFDQNKEGNYVTIFGQPLASTGYVSWYPGEPSGKGTENCGSISTTAQYNDLSCSGTAEFICEQRTS